MSHHSRVLTAAELRNAVPHVAPATRLAITFLFLATLAVPGRAQVPLHVSTEGDDGWSGQRDTPNDNRTDGPLASLQRAVSLSRQAAAARTPRRIVIHEGRYFHDQSLDLGPADSGLEIAAAENAKVIIYGGRPIRGWHRVGDNLWSADVPEVRDGRWDFRLLVVNERLCPRARLPKTGTFTHKSVFDVPWMSTTGGGWKRKPSQEELTTLTYRPEDLGAWLDARNAEVTVYHMWDESVVGVSEIDALNQTLKFSTPCGHPPGAFGVQTYVVWNVREGLTEPGQWYLDRSAGQVVYWPLPGEDLDTARVLAPTVPSILRIQGRADQPVRDVTIRGLVLSVTNTPLVAGGFGAGNFPGAVELTHVDNCRLADLEIRNVAGQGIKAWNLQSTTLEDCHIHDTGACGLKFGGACLVRNNLVHHVGRLYPSAIAIWGDGSDGQVCRIEHNTLHDTPYTAIACGGDDHRIEHNHIFRAMQELHDGAGIYISSCKRMVVSGNFIHDIVDTGGYGASAYYLDEQAEDCLVVGNLSVGVARPSQNHMARRNTLRNNLFVCDGDATLAFARCSDYVLEKNVVVAHGAIEFTRPEAIIRSENNIVFSEQGSVKFTTLDDYRPVGSAAIQGAGWLQLDPRLTEYAQGRVVFGPDSPVAGTGFTALDVRSAGCQPNIGQDH